MKDDINQQILKELKKLNSLSIWISVSFALILIILISAPPRLQIQGQAKNKL
jgi:hypothetical protein